MSKEAEKIHMDKIHRDFRLILDSLKEVMIGLGEEAFLPYLPYPDQDLPPIHTVDDHPEKISELLSLSFQLLNMVEENSSAQFRRRLVMEEGLDHLNGQWGEVLKSLLDAGLGEDEIASLLSSIHIEPVLTAHPTEAKRATILEHYRELYIHIVSLENQMWTDNERSVILEDIRTCLERLWRTGEIMLRKPDVESEIRNIYHYLRHVFPEALWELDQHLVQAWKFHGLNPEILEDFNNFPRITFGNWVGGDRDGHPLITSRVTSETLTELRNGAISLVRDELEALARKLSLSARFQSPSHELLERIKEKSRIMGVAGKEAVERNPDEPWRQFINLMIASLPEKLEADHERHVYNPEEVSYHYKSSMELLDDLSYLKDALKQIGTRRLISRDLRRVERIVKTFGFRLAGLDLRQNSTYHEKAITQLLRAAGFDDYDYASWDEDKRMTFINEELKSPRPFVLPRMKCGEEADRTIASYRVLASHIERFGYEAMGSLIVSMTRSLSDLMLVFLLAREAGLIVHTNEGLACMLPVVPLFETIEDLDRAPGILEQYINHPFIHRSLVYRARKKNIHIPVQQVMLGYSDSSKGGGILASQWKLFEAQKKLSGIGRKYNVKIRFFHGRGGTISRGGGKTHHFIKALPDGSVTGDIRMTVQGETIAQQYANRGNAVYNLELFLAGTAAATGLHWNTQIKDHPLESVLSRLASVSEKTYVALLEEPGFLEFYSQATPIDAIENSRIGSRPSRRTGERTFEDLRAIPWVFSWNQARFYLAGWFGTGSALYELKSKSPEDFKKLQEGIGKWHFVKYLLMNIETSHTSADPEIMKSYSDLVQNDEVRKHILGIIQEEYEKTAHMLKEVFGGNLKERRPRMYETMQLRQSGLKLLHHLQIELLKKWRSGHKTGSANESEMLLIQLLQTINSIAGGLRTTG